MKTFLDFGAGWKAIHTISLREHGLNVTAHDFGRNFDPNIHDKDALTRQYDVVFASNVVNVHASRTAMCLTLAQICKATKVYGVAIINYPDSPRKNPNVSTEQMKEYLKQFFGGVIGFPGRKVWECVNPRYDTADAVLKTSAFTPEDIASANIRPAGAVGGNAIVPRIVLDRFKKHQSLWKVEVAA